MPHVIAVQLDIVWEDKAANHRRVRELLAGCGAIAPGSFIVLPEMFATGFSLAVERTAESSPPAADGTEAFLAGLARDYQCVVMGGLTKRDPATGKGLNQAAIYGPDGREVVRYNKLHPFTYAGERDHFLPGSGLKSFAWQGFTVCPLICYDLRFPEAFRLAARAGADFFPVIANFPTPRESHWITLLTARAIENQAYVLGVNRTGADPNAPYPGRSLLIDPRGEVVADAGRQECILRGDLDLASLQEYRKRFAALADMRGDLLPPPA